MHELKRMTVALCFGFLSSQWLYLMEAMAHTRLSSRTLQSGTVSPAVLPRKVRNSESLRSNKMTTKILSGSPSTFEVGNSTVSHK